MTNPSILAPVGMALETVRRVLFQPFNLVKWLALGFTAWLAALEGGLGYGGNFNFGSCKKEPAAQYCRAGWDWIQAHLFFVIPLALLLVAVGLVAALLILWVSYRGKFMFLDNVVANRGEIVRPWQQFRAQGNSCFLFAVCFGLAALAVVLLGVGLVLLISWPDLARGRFGWNAAGGIAVGLVFLTCFLITVGCVKSFLEDFVIPIMAVQKCRVMEGWSIFFDRFRRQVGLLVLYLLFRLALGLAIGFITLFLCCLLCCTVLIPYVGTVILLPFLVFWRSYSVHFLGQFDAKLRMFHDGYSSYITLAPGT